MSPRNSKEQTFYWGGFLDGELDHLESAQYGGLSHTLPALFLTRKEARQFYSDVRKVRIAKP